MVVGCAANEKEYCGSHLATTLSFICEKGYNSYPTTKTSHQFQKRLLQNPGFPFVPKSNQLMSGKSFRRFRRGITEECCKKDCTFNELKSYCI